MAFDNTAGYPPAGDGYQQNQQGAQDNLRAAALCPPQPGHLAQPGQFAQPGLAGGPNEWRPNPNTAEGQQWVANAQAKLFQPLQLNQDGTYTTQPYDGLSTIAARELHMAGQRATKSAIDGEVQRLIQLNQDRLPQLASNPGLLPNGVPLRLSDGAMAQQPQYYAPPQPEVAPAPRVAQQLPPADVPAPVVQPVQPYAYQPNVGGDLAAGVGGFLGAALMGSLIPRRDYGYYPGYYGGPVYYGGGYHPHYWHRR